MKRKAESDYRRQLEEERQRAIEESHWVVAVSYTHLTLPTIYSV